MNTSKRQWKRSKPPSPRKPPSAQKNPIHHLVLPGLTPHTPRGHVPAPALDPQQEAAAEDHSPVPHHTPVHDHDRARGVMIPTPAGHVRARTPPHAPAAAADHTPPASAAANAPTPRAAEAAPTPAHQPEKANPPHAAAAPTPAPARL